MGHLVPIFSLLGECLVPHLMAMLLKHQIVVVAWGHGAESKELDIVSLYEVAVLSLHHNTQTHSLCNV